MLERRVLLAAPEYEPLTGFLYIEFTTTEATSVTVDSAPVVVGGLPITRVTYSGAGATTVWHENLHPTLPFGVDPSLIANITVYQGYGEDDPPGNVFVNLSGVTVANGFSPGRIMTATTHDGNDTIFGSDMNENHLNGHEGDDTIVGGTRSDLINGDEGNDSLIGGTGVSAGDEINGGEDNDTIRAATYDATIPAPDTLSGGNQLNGQFGNDSIIGDSGNDSITGGPGNDEIDSKSGNDSINAGPDIDAGPDDDQVTAGVGDDTVFGGRGNDVINTDVGNDVVSGGADNDNIIAGDDNDRLVGGGGNDTILGGDGFDYIYGDGDETHPTTAGEKIDSYPANPGADSLEGGNGYDAISGGEMSDVIIAGAGGLVSPGLSAGSHINGGPGNDTIDGSDGPTDDEAMDTIIGDQDNDIIRGLGGIDELFGRAGYDLIHGGAGNDIIEGGEGNDTLYGEADRDKISGQEEYDTIDGGTEDDFTLSGGDQPDLINGGPGVDDGFSGGKGDDTLWSGDGAPDAAIEDMIGKGNEDCDLEDGRPDGDPGCACVQIEVSPSMGHFTRETGTTTAFDVSLSHEPADDVTISLTSSNLIEGTLSVASLTFTPSNWATLQTVTGTGMNDGLPDSDQFYDVVFGTAVSTDPLYSGKTPSPISVLNIALPVVSVTATNASEVPMPPVMSTVGKFTISRSSSDMSSALDVHYLVSGSATPVADYNLLSGTATIPAGDPSVDVIVVAAPDNLIEGTETVLMTLVRSPFYPDYEPVIPDPGAPYPGTLTISEPLYDVTFDVDDVIASEDVGNMVFTVTIAPPTGMTYLGTLTVNYSVAGDAGGDFTATSGTLTFSNFSGVQTATISVGIIDDTADESTEFLFVSFALASSSPPIRPDAFTMTLGVGQIVDNDDPVMPPMPPMPLITFAPLLPPPGSPLLPGMTGFELFSATTSESNAAFSVTEASGDGGASSGSDDGGLGNAAFGVDVTAGGDAVLEMIVLTADADESATGAWIVTSEVTTPLRLDPDDSSDSSVAGQYPDSDGNNAVATTSGMTTDTLETVAQLGDELFALSSGETDVMGMLLLDSNASVLMESAPPGTDPSFGENSQLVVTADGGVVVGTLN